MKKHILSGIFWVLISTVGLHTNVALGDLSDIFLSPTVKVDVENNISFLEGIYVAVESDKHKAGPYFCFYGFSCLALFDVAFRIDRPNTIYVYPWNQGEKKATKRLKWTIDLEPQGKKHHIRLDSKFYTNSDKYYLIYEYELNGKKQKPLKMTGDSQRLVNGQWVSGKW